ncbi:hypothetical protein ACRAWD_06940 [Caulobacter segnis]
MLSPTPLATGCSSAWAQGGMAAALSNEDSPALHAADTIAAWGGPVRSGSRRPADPRRSASRPRPGRPGRAVRP